ncbi:hypothetical protein [Paractinoplanes rishiriensis]|uniref:Uncharacterized protein n=1 Tax=Paractinoplanes rishiriensis TaxID=1050105 RepID=A0A919K3P0_9ACTN|nr:hypothetical protein [Actinoplanes rishiriensis]GIE98247.1 hypothetical protein Ari01nite_57120 [Actinoplanes rishiriensis]
MAGQATGVGGRTGTALFDGSPVFVKWVPLTDGERQRSGSTANLFGLPLHYQYGIGSAGFGAWRELAAHRMTTEWALSGRYAGVPLLYHWRIVPRVPAPDPDDVDRWGRGWRPGATRRLWRSWTGPCGRAWIFWPGRGWCTSTRTSATCSRMASGSISRTSA